MAGTGSQEEMKPQLSLTNYVGCKVELLTIVNGADAFFLGIFAANDLIRSRGVARQLAERCARI